MATRTYHIDDTPETLLEETTTNLTLIRADPLAAPLVPRFEALIGDWTEVSAIRVELIVAIATAVARAFYIDEQLNLVADELVSILQNITKRDRSDPLWRVFFGGEDPSHFKRPCLGSQLTAMRLWPAALTASPHDELKALGAKLTPLLPDADAAEEDVMTTKQKLVEFRNVGRWRQHVDMSNAERKAAFGFLSELPHKYPELKLPLAYADFFFRHDTSRRGAGAHQSSAQIDARIEALEQKLAALKAEKEAALEREQKASEIEAKREAQLTALAEARIEEKAAKAKAAAIEKELKKSAKKR